MGSEVVDLVESRLLGSSSSRWNRSDWRGLRSLLDPKGLSKLSRYRRLGDVALRDPRVLATQVLIYWYLRGCSRGEGKVTQLPLDRVDARRCADGPRCPAAPWPCDMLCLGHGAQRAHVVEGTVGEL